MKKIILILIAVFLLFANQSYADGIVRSIGKKYDNVPVAADTPWTVLLEDGQSVTEIKPSTYLLGQPVKHIFQFTCAQATVVNVATIFNSISKVHTFDVGQSFGAEHGHQNYVLLTPGMKYTIQHKGPGNIDCTVIIIESFNVDL